MTLAVSDATGPRPPSMSSTDENIKAVKKMILDNRLITITEVAKEVAYRSVFTDVLGMKSVATKIVPKLLNFKQKHLRIGITQEMITTINYYRDLLKKVITDDKSWVYGYDIETKAQ